MLVMELMDESLYALLKKRGTLDVETATSTCFGILNGLEFMHQHGRVHRDIKPDNILLSSTDTGFIVKLAGLYWGNFSCSKHVLPDFGSSRPIEPISTLTPGVGSHKCKFCLFVTATN